MRPFFLHLDDALHGQPRLLGDGAQAGCIQLDGRILGPRLRLWAYDEDLEALRALVGAALPDDGVPTLTFYGSGDFHHVAALLIGRVAARVGPLTVIHIDNHPDWVRFRGGMHCGSWVSRAARLPGVARVLTIGPCSSDIRQPWRKGADLALVRQGQVELYPHGADGIARHRAAGVARPTIAGLGEAAFLDLLDARIATEAVYITIDKDALRPADAVSNWDQGRLTFDFLDRLIARLAATRRIVGADVCGDWSPPRYGGTRVVRARKRIEAWLDQPRGSAPPSSELTVNERANRALLARFRCAA